MNPNNKISVIINCLNGESFVERCIYSVLNQSYKNFEVIFWDNNSDDNSYKIASNFNSKKIKIYKSNSTLKLYKARNEAIKKTKGKYLAFIDIDDIWYKNKLKKQISLLKKEKSDLIFTNYYKIDKYHKKLFFKRNEKKGEDLIKKILTNNPICISTILVKKESFNRIGRFNPSYEIIGDFDFYIRFCKRFKVSSIYEPLIDYHVHGNNFSIKKINKRITEMKLWLKQISKLNYFKEYSRELENIKDKNVYLELTEKLKNKNKIIFVKIFSIKSYFLKIKIIIKYLINLII